MATRIAETKDTIVLENSFAEIIFSKKDSKVLSIKAKNNGKDIKGEDTYFFSLKNDADEDIAVTGVSLKGDIITVTSEKGSFDVKAEAFDTYFTFEVISPFPDGVFKGILAHLKYDYDKKDKSAVGAAGISMTIWANPVFYPEPCLETRCEVYHHLGDVDAKYGLLIAPLSEHKSLLKTMFLTIDKTKGIVSSTGGVFTEDYRPNFTNYTIQYNSTREFIDNNVEYYKKIGVDQIDFHPAGNHRNGDYKPTKYPTHKEFKENVSDVLAANGIATGLHTYSNFIGYNCDALLADPKWQKDLMIIKTFTLAEDLTDESEYLVFEEGDYPLPAEQKDRKKETPFLLIGEELVEFERTEKGLKITRRGSVGTKKVLHKKGESVRHVAGWYGVTPILGSKLFYEIARLIAKAYNDGGFKMIYLDALDGMFHIVDRKSDYWFYCTAFVHEVLKNCHDDPILEGADFSPAWYAGRGRCGAWDTPNRAYKRFVTSHSSGSEGIRNRYLTSTLGWYNFYPTEDTYPGNEQIKYQHTDDIEYMGKLAIINDASNVINGSKDTYNRYAGLRRNIAVYKKYDDLRKKQYFSEEYREKMKASKWELQLREKRGGKFTFVEKDYQLRKLYDLSDEERNTPEFKNPFGAQVPFVRIEALLSTDKKNGMVMMKMSERFDVTEHKLTVDYGTPLNFQKNLAKVVRIKGNGVEGSKIGVKLKTEDSYMLYVIDTDFEDWREFYLIEQDTGERLDHNFENGVSPYAYGRTPFAQEKITGIEILTEGDVTGVRMTDIIAYEHLYDVLKNPTIRIRDTYIMFECELKSTDFIEFDGKTAKVVDRYGNEKEIWFKSENFKAPRGRFDATLEVKSLNRLVPRAELTLGFTGKEIK